MGKRETPTNMSSIYLRWDANMVSRELSSSSLQSIHELINGEVSRDLSTCWQTLLPSSQKLRQTWPGWATMQWFCDWHSHVLYSGYCPGCEKHALCFRTAFIMIPTPIILSSLKCLWLGRNYNHCSLKPTISLCHSCMLSFSSTFWGKVLIYFFQ